MTLARDEGSIGLQWRVGTREGSNDRLVTRWLQSRVEQTFSRVLAQKKGRDPSSRTETFLFKLKLFPSGHEDLLSRGQEGR